jgi:hypothetical protein
MNLDDLEKAVLAAARHEATPSDMRALRARDAVLARIAGGAATSAGSASVAAGTGPLHVGLGALAKGKALSLLVMAGLGFTSGWASHALLQPRASESARAATSSPAGPPTRPEVPVVRVEGPARAVEVPPVSPVQAPPTSPPPPRAQLDGPTSARLREEVGLLRAVDRALRAHDPAGAERALGELERRLPDGKLGEEREAAHVLAACMRGSTPSTRNAAQSFLAGHPTTVYSGRIRQTCELSSPPGDGTD